MLTKQIVLVDDTVDVHDDRAVWFHVAASMLPERDIFTVGGPAHPFDPAHTGIASSTKLAIDATTRRTESQDTTLTSGVLSPGPEQRALLDRRWQEYSGK